MAVDRGGGWSGGRLRRWLARYAPAEAAAILGAVLGAGVADRFGASAAATAFAGTIGEGLAFYAVIIVRDLRARPPGHDRALVRVLRDVSLEFGPAEVLDTVAVRPLAMYLGPLLVGSLTAGVVLGKIVADIVFYTLAILGYEARRSLGTLPPSTEGAEVGGAAPARHP